jgi:division protein CdvB (Snf7/Vps24/ESCRT-III family)
VKTILRRLQQLELHSAESLAASDSSGALERIPEKLNAMADLRRGNPNWEAARPTLEQVKARVKEAVSLYRVEAAR